MTAAISPHGFELRDGAGDFIAWYEHCEDACKALRLQVRGSHVVRCADGALIATASPRTQRRA